MSWAVHVAGCSWCGTAAQHIKGFLAKKISNTYKIIIIIIIIIGKKNQNSPLFPPLPSCPHYSANPAPFTYIHTLHPEMDGYH